MEVLSHQVAFGGRTARMALIRDVTERRRRDDQLLEAEGRMRFALEASGVGIWEANLRTGVSYWSATCEAMHGLEPGSFGQTFDAFIAQVHPDDRAHVGEETQAAMQQRRPLELEYRTTWPDGTEAVAGVQSQAGPQP